MNDERQFLPIQLPKGNVIILRKKAIFKVVPLDQHLEHDKIMDPYDILGVPRVSHPVPWTQVCLMRRA